MQVPIQISFRHMDHSDALEADIRDKAKKLEQFHHQVISCRVVVEPSHKHKHKGNLYQVHVDVRVPGKEIVVSREPDKNHAHEDPYVSIRDAFDAVRRQLDDYSRIQNKKVKAHEVAPHGRISELVPGENYGRITTPDGRDIYFHRNSVLGADFEKLEIGNEVSFSEEMGDEGPQASTVHVLGKHHIVG